MTRFQTFVVTAVFIAVLWHGESVLSELPSESPATILYFYIPFAAGGAAALTRWLFLTGNGAGT